MAMQIEEYDAGLLNDYGGGDIDWWQDYIRAELGRAYEYYQSQLDIQHCEAGPEYCQQCLVEDRSKAFAAAIGYIQRNTPPLVYKEILMAFCKKKSKLRQVMTVDELKERWNSEADHMNQWDELGLDEIVFYAQTAHRQAK
jgi:hypothetical protein